MDNLNFADLIETLNANANCLQEARNVFIKNYRDINFIVRSLLDDGVGINDDHTGMSIYLNRYDVIMYILANFGDLITRFVISFENIPLEDGHQIMKRINNKISATFEWLYLYGCRGNVLDGLNAFNNVKRLIFASNSQNEQLIIHSECDTLSRLFPRLINLVLQNPTTSDWTFIDGNIPTLVDLEIELLWNNANNIVASDAVQFLKSNVQIDTLTIMNTDLQFIKLANDNLPQLKILNLNWLAENYLAHNCDPIHLITVEELSVELRFDDEIPEKIFVHDQLKALSLTVHLSSANKWTEFIANQVTRNLAEFRLNYDGLTHEQLLNIIKQLNHLQVLDISCKTEFVADEILDFLKMSNALAHFKFALQMNESEQNCLKENLPGNWNIEFKKVDRAVEITFKR